MAKAMIWDKNENHLQTIVGTFVMYHLKRKNDDRNEQLN